MKKTLATTFLFLSVCGAADAQAIRNLAGFRSGQLQRNDDGSSATMVPLGFTLNFFGRQRSHAFVNNNGNITFDTALSTYTPFGLVGTRREIIAAFFADVDTRDLGSAVVTYGQDTVNGRPAFGVNYLNVGYFASHADKLNSFQLILIDRSDTGQGNFDIEFNYQRILWETGDASGGVGGYGGVPAAVGWSNGSGDPGTYFELEGSLISGSFLDGSRLSLVRNRLNSSVGGRYAFRARDGIVLPPLTMVTGCPLPPANIGSPYTFRFSAIGGTDYRWAILPDPGASLPAGLSLAENGLFTGTPTVAGETEFTIRLTSRTDEGEQVLSKRCSLAVRPPTLSIISACPLPSATVGVPYSRTLQVNGGRGPYRWNLAEFSAPLPKGLALSASGTLSGVPTQPGSTAVTVEVASSGSDGAAPAQKTCGIVVRPAVLDMSAGCSLPAATLGVPYGQMLTVSGGTEPYTWSALSSVPAGLSLNASGKLEGVPTVEGATTFGVQVRDGSGTTRDRSCSMRVDAPVLTVSTACPLAPAMVGRSYSQTLAVSGGQGPYSWSSLDMLPAGLTLSGDGVLSGSPGATGPFAFRLYVSDANGRAATKSCTISVGRSEYSLSSCPLPDATVGSSYATDVRVSGGKAPHYYSTAGSLPPGLTLTGNGLINGVPRQAGTFPLNLRVMDSMAKTLTQSCQITIRPSPVEISRGVCPMPEANVGQAYSHRFTAAGGTAPYLFRVDGHLPAGLELSSDGVVRGAAVSPGESSFEIEAVDASRRSVAQACSIRVSLPDFPQIKLSGVPVTVPASSSGPVMTMELAEPYSLPIHGELRLESAAETGSNDVLLNRSDPRVRFTNGQRVVPFTVRPGSRQVTAQIATTGTVAGTTTVSIGNVRVGSTPVYSVPSPRQFKVARSAPVITDGCFQQTEAEATLNLSGYSTTREVTGVALTYSTGGAEKSVEIGVGDTGYAYFASDEAVRNGGAFQLSFPVSIGATPVESLSVQLLNAVGISGKRSLQRCR